MPTAYNNSDCVGWYVAGRGVWADVAGPTPAGHGDGVARWDDLSGAGNHLVQPTAASRPACNAPAAAVTAGGPANVAPYGTAVAVDDPACARSVVFDGNTSSLTLPVTLTVPATGFTVVACTRGAESAPVVLGTGSSALAYGWMTALSPRAMGVYTAATGPVPFPAATYLPTLTPIVHGLRCGSAPAETRLYVGTNQQTALAVNYAAATLTGGTVGLAPGVGDGLAFTGEVFELLVFSRPLDDVAMATLLADVQTANRIRADANRTQVVFVGDSLTTGGPGLPPVSKCYPWHLCRQFGLSFKPLVVAAPGHTVAQQRALVDAQVVPLDRSVLAANVAVVCCGGTDLAQGTAPADVAAAVADLCAALRTAGFKVVVATITPRAAATTAGQVTLSTAIDTANDAIRSAYRAYADALVDWAADARLADYTDATYFAADGWHTTDAGDGVKAALVKGAIDPLLAPPSTLTVAAPLAYATFYAGGTTFAGRYGRFPRG